MSVSASLDIKLFGDKDFPPSELLSVLGGYGWSFFYEGSARYLPLGDDDDFDWKKDSVSEDELVAIVREKESLGEQVGVVMVWDDSGIGGEFLFRSPGEVSFNLSINRKVDECYITDVNWYVQKIVPAFIGAGFNVESLEFSQHM